MCGETAVGCQVGFDVLKTAQAKLVDYYRQCLPQHRICKPMASWRTQEHQGMWRRRLKGVFKANMSNCGWLSRCHFRGTTSEVGLMTAQLVPQSTWKPFDFVLQML